MNRSDSIKNIAPAFLKAQKEMEAVTKNAKNPFFKSEYADLNAVMETCKEPLNNNGISVLQPVNSNHVETVLMHESGEWFASETALVIKEQSNPQALGSAISYARRYGLMSILGLPAEDDDAEKAMVRDEPKKPVVNHVTSLPNQATDEENGKATAVKVLYGVLYGKGLDAKKVVPLIAAQKGHGSIGALSKDEILEVAKALRELDGDQIMATVSGDMGDLEKLIFDK